MITGRDQALEAVAPRTRHLKRVTVDIAAQKAISSKRRSCGDQGLNRLNREHGARLQRLDLHIVNRVAMMSSHYSQGK